MAMLNFFSSIAGNPMVLLLAFLGGTIPAVLWLLFWLSEDREDPEPTLLLVLTFISGMLAVVLVLPIQKYISTLPYQKHHGLLSVFAARKSSKFAA